MFFFFTNIKYLEVYCCANVSTLFPSKLYVDHNLNSRNEWESTVVRSLIGKNIMSNYFNLVVL